MSTTAVRADLERALEGLRDPVDLPDDGPGYPPTTVYACAVCEHPNLADPGIVHDDDCPYPLIERALALLVEPHPRSWRLRAGEDSDEAVPA